MSHDHDEACDDSSLEQVEPDVRHTQPLEEQGQVEVTLRAREDLYHIIVQTANEGIWLIDAGGRTLYTNERMAVMLGTTTAELASRSVLDFVFPEDEAESRGRIDSNLQGRFEQFASRFRRKDGSVLYTLAATSLVRDEAGKVVGSLGMFTDITPRKQAEQALSAQAGELEALFEAITDGIFVYDADGRLRRMNSAARALLSRYIPPDDFTVPAQARAEHYNPRSPEGRPLLPEQVPVIRMLRGEVFTGAKTADVLMRTFDGEDLWLNMSGTPLRDATGQIAGAIAIARDVSERRQLEQRTRVVLETLLQMAQVMVQGNDVDAFLSPETGGISRETMQRLAELARQVLGCSRLSFTRVEAETEILRPLAVVGLSPKQEQRWWQEQEQQPGRLSDGPDPSLVERLRADEVLLVDLSKPPYADLPNPYGVLQMLVAPLILGNRLLGFLSLDYGGLAHQYTDEEIALVRAVSRLATLVMERDSLFTEAALARAKALAAVEASQRMDNFLGIASHELKTPLTAIRGNLQLTKRRITTTLREVSAEHDRLQRQLEEVQKLLDRAERQVGIQNRLVSDLVDISRIQADKLELRLEPAELTAIVREVVEDQCFIAPERLIAFESSVPAIGVRADTERIGQVINNYLSNALKYSAENRPVLVRLDVEGEFVRVSVLDRGPGLAVEQQSRVWERFYRVPEIKVQSGSGVGLGLGLHISRTIIEQHGGQVGVSSAPGLGSTFWFTLPIERQDEG